MTDRRTPKIQIGRRKTDIPVAALEQFKDEMKEHVAETIELVVNGQIRNIDTTLKNYIKEDTAWKETMEPVRKAFNNTSWLWNIFIGFLKTIGLLGTAGAAILLIRSFLNRP